MRELNKETLIQFCADAYFAQPDHPVSTGCDMAASGNTPGMRLFSHISPSEQHESAVRLFVGHSAVRAIIRALIAEFNLPSAGLSVDIIKIRKDEDGVGISSGSSID